MADFVIRIPRVSVAVSEAELTGLLVGAGEHVEAGTPTFDRAASRCHTFFSPSGQRRLVATLRSCGLAVLSFLCGNTGHSATQEATRSHISVQVCRARVRRAGDTREA